MGLITGKSSGKKGGRNGVETERAEQERRMKSRSEREREERAEMYKEGIRIALGERFEAVVVAARKADVCSWHERRESCYCERLEFGDGWVFFDWKAFFERGLLDFY